METIYTILFTAPGMPVTLFAASSRALLAHKVRDAANERIAMLNAALTQGREALDARLAARGVRDGGGEPG